MGEVFGIHNYSVYTISGRLPKGSSSGKGNPSRTLFSCPTDRAAPPSPHRAARGFSMAKSTASLLVVPQIIGQIGHRKGNMPAAGRLDDPDIDKAAAVLLCVIARNPHALSNICHGAFALIASHGF